MKTTVLALRIGELSRKSGASVDTIRYYEREGLLKKPARSGGGFRIYPPEAVDQMVFIQKAQGFGLTLREIKQILSCGSKGLEPCCDLTVDLFTRKIDEFEGKVRELNRMKRKLRTVLGRWVPAQGNRTGRKR